MKDAVKELQKNFVKNVEYGIALGGFVIKPYVTKGVDNKYKIKFDYVLMTNFYPLSFSSSQDVIEAVFTESITTDKFVYTKVEHHKLEGTNLLISTYAFKKAGTAITYSESDLGTPVSLKEVPQWAEIEPVVTINNVDTLLFAFFKMPQANIVDPKSPLGVSGFAKAINLIKDADEQYANLKWEFDGSQLAIDVDKTALVPQGGGKAPTLPKRQQRLYRDSLDLGSDDSAYHVFSPQIRDDNIINGLNTILMQIEDKCCLSRGTLSQVQYTDARTATELKILKQRAYADNKATQEALQTTLEALFNILDIFCDLYTLGEGDFEVGYAWDDSIIVDKDTEKQSDLLDVDKGLMSRVEYRMKWYGETREQAEEVIKEIDEQQMDKMTMQQEVMQQATFGAEHPDSTKSQDVKSGKQQEQDSKTKANESGEIKNKE
jgi:A118 family predicted phage portal protein